MAIKLTDLPVITSSTITESYSLFVGTTTDSSQLTIAELGKSFTNLRARTTAGINLYGYTVQSGISVSDAGYVGIDKPSPTVALDIGDIGTNGNAQVRINGSTAARKIAFSLQDPSVTWRTTKRGSDTDFYLEVSQDGGTTVTGVLNADVNGNVGIFDGSASLSDKFYVKGGSVKFENGGSGISFSPDVAEIKTSVANDKLYLNKSNNDDVILGNNVVFVDNDATNPRVGINQTSPAYVLDVAGSSQIARFHNTASASSSISLTNTSATAYFGLHGANVNIGSVATSSVNNLVYKTDTYRLGLGTVSPENKLHIFSSTDSALAKIETTAGNKLEVIQANNFDSTGPFHNVLTFSKQEHVGNVSNTKRWSVGLYDDGGSSYDDVFAFRVDGDTASESSIKAYLDRDGNFNLKGSVTTSSAYCKGKFIQVFKSRVNATSIYFDPTSTAYSSTPDNHTSTEAPFAIMPYDGRVEKIQIISSNDDADLVALTLPRIEIAAITPVFNTPPSVTDLTAFVATPGAATYGSLGIIGYYQPTLHRNSVTTITRAQFQGSTSFSAGQLLQYRICQDDGTATNCNFTVMSHISFTIT